MPLPYTTLGNVTGSLYSGSFLTDQDTELFTLSSSADMWFGLSANDVIEFAAYDPKDDSLVGWATLNQDKTFTTNTLTYLDSLNVPKSFNYRTLDNPFTLYKNSGILINPSQDLNSLGITDGSYKVSYAFSRDMAGSPTSPLSIKDISPSRTEIKLIPHGGGNVQYEAFCRKKFPTRDVSSLLISITQKCPYDQVYSVISKNADYQSGINYLKFVFFLQDDGAVISFLKNLYEDYVKYTSLTDSQINSGLEPTRVTRIQGIQSYFSNFLLSSLDSITDFDSIEQKFGEFVNIRLDQRFGGLVQSQSVEYRQARKFCYDFFFKYYYEAFVHPVQNSHQLKYFSYLKNALNFGNNKYFTILDHDFIDERTNVTDPLTLILKISTSLPNDISVKDTCWVSNFGMSPYVLTVILQNPVKYKTIKISSPNFGATSQFITPENVNKLYSAEDLTLDSDIQDNVTINKNATSLNIDYTKLENFVIFSSANTRLSIFENKVKNWYILSSSLDVLESKYLTSLSSSISYPYYLNEKNLIVDQMSEVVNSFDGFESYLFYGNNYQYSVVSGSFVNYSYVLSQREAAQEYDSNNHDSLIANTPEYILNDSNNDEYLTFLQMIGHHFDNIYTYISALPIERQLKNEVSSSISTGTLKQMLSSAGWNVEDIIGTLDVDEVYLNSLDGSSYDVLSAEQRMQIIWNRILVTLPGIYKTKGTEECVKYLLSCYGLPSSLIAIREYGGTDYSEETEPTYKLDEKTFFMRLSGISDYVEGPVPQSVKTVEFKFSVEEADSYTNRTYYPLFKNIAYPNTNPDLSAWSVGITRMPGQFMGQVEFRMESGSTATKVTSSLLPIFNGQIFSVMLRRESVDGNFEYTSNTNSTPRNYDLVVQRNEDGRRIFYSTSSAILYEQDNTAFAKFGRFHFGNGVPGGKFIGTLDKLCIWDVPLDDSSWEEHVNDLNSFGLSGSNVYQNLWVRLGVDYPLSLYSNLNGSSSVWVDNQSPYYAIPNYYIGGLSGSIDGTLYSASLDIIENRWSAYYPTGSVEIIARNFPAIISPNYTTSYDCGWKSGSAYPFSYREYTYQQDIDASKFGPNKFKNKKIRKVDYSVEARFDSEDKSTNLINSTISGESNQIGFFIDPQDHKNKDIIRYIGRQGIMDLIADPSNLYESKYTDLVNKNIEYNSTGNKKTYFNEMLTLYKFYFDKSIFQAIKNVLPARANIFTGVVVEPTILERPKYQNRPIQSDMSTNIFSSNISPIKGISSEGSWINLNVNYTINNAQSMTTQSMTLLKNSMPPNYFAGLDMSDLNNPTIDYPNNLHQHCIADSLDMVQFTKFADFESYPRLWEVTPDSPGGWPTTPIYGSTTRDNPDNPFVIGPDQNSVVRTTEPTSAGYNTGSHQILYYLLKVWERYSYYNKSGPYYHSDVPRENTYTSNSIYLYKYITVSEPFLRRYLYWYDQVPLIAGNDDPSPLYAGGQYIHRVNTFKGTPDLPVSNVYAYGINNFSHTYAGIAFRPDNIYFEVVRGYPRNHYTHKLMMLSPTQYSKIYNGTSKVVFIKGRNTNSTTVNSEGINDGTLPVQSFNTSNVNVINSTNVIQSGVSVGGSGAVIPSGGSGVSTGGSTTISTPSTGGGGTSSGGLGGCLIAGTKIRMFDSSLRNVEDIQVGDRLMGYNGQIVQVQELKPNRWNEYYIINRKLKITWEHPVMVKEGPLSQLIVVRDLRPGDQLVRFDGELEEIFSIVTVYGETPTYNFVVDGDHLYTADDIIVHNPTIAKF